MHQHVVPAYADEALPQDGKVGSAAVEAVLEHDEVVRRRRGDHSGGEHFSRVH